VLSNQPRLQEQQPHKQQTQQQLQPSRHSSSKHRLQL
jgi:hypothetical protein